jgi:peptide/nickel transport system permease protein
MLRFIHRRLVGMVFVLFAISILVFLIFNVVPATNPAQRIAGKNATPQLVKNVEEDLGFDKSLPEQYLTQMKLIFTGELESYTTAHENVDERILEGVPATFSLCIGAAVIWLAFGILFGYFSAIRAGKLTDRALTVVALVGISMPVFWLATIFLYYLTFKVELFPASSYVKLTEDPIQWANHLILPWITLAVLFVGFYSRVLRSSMLDVMNEDYVRTAKAKGLNNRRVMTRHVLRNSLIPIVTLFGLDFGAVLGGGAIVTESIFNIEGVGFYAAEAVAKQDFPPIMAITIFGAFFIVLFNAIVDIAYAYLDPRIRLGTAAAA